MTHQEKRVNNLNDASGESYSLNNLNDASGEGYSLNNLNDASGERVNKLNDGSGERVNNLNDAPGEGYSLNNLNDASGERVTKQLNLNDQSATRGRIWTTKLCHERISFGKNKNKGLVVQLWEEHKENKILLAS